MFGFTFNNTGNGPQNIANGNGPQYIHSGPGTQNHYYGSEVDRRALQNRETSKPSRDEFEVGIICALAIEYDAILLLFDRFWDEDGEPSARAKGDQNTYKTGRIRNHNVVLTRLPEMGKVAATGAAARFQTSYPNLKLVLLVGICGGVPTSGSGANELMLGDVVISKTVIQYDFGRRYPNHKFVAKDTIDDNLGRSNRDIRGLIASFDNDNERTKLERTAGRYLKDLQAAAARGSSHSNFQYPGMAEDKLFPPDYRHKHRKREACRLCEGKEDGFCERAANASCIDLKCDERLLVTRERLRASRWNSDGTACHKIFIGRMASGDTVMKSGEDRDRIARELGVIAFEMEGAGVWDYLPCVVVKGVCDYADSHKNKKWQPFAAATAACVMKAVLGRYPLTDRAGPAQYPGYW